MLTRSRSSIIGLLFFRGPAAIAGLVIAVIIWEAINRMKRTWPLPHIFKEGRKGLAPSLAYGNATTAVIVVVLILGVFASLHHIGPALVFWRAQIVAGIEVPAASFLASHNVPGTESDTGHDALLTTFTFASPVRAFSSIDWPRNVFGNGQAAKDATYFIFDWSPATTRMCISHDVNLAYRFAKWLEPFADHNSVRGSFILSHRRGGA